MTTTSSTRVWPTIEGLSRASQWRCAAASRAGSASPWRYVLAALFTTALLGGCGGSSAPSERLVTAEAAIRGGIEINANASPPRAALHLQLAQEQVDKAKRYIADGMNERADLALRQAQADAELAIVLARAEEMKQKADAARLKIERLKAGKTQ